MHSKKYTNGTLSQKYVTIELCEGCGEGIGHTNSRHWLDENGEGRWVCWACEDALEVAVSQCPCGCGGNLEICAYANEDNTGDIGKL